MPIGNNPVLRLLLSFLEGGASRIRAGMSTAGTNSDLACHAVGLAIVVNAILYVATDSLDGILAATVLIRVHHLFIPPLMRILLLFS